SPTNRRASPRGEVPLPPSQTRSDLESSFSTVSSSCGHPQESALAAKNSTGQVQVCGRANPARAIGTAPRLVLQPGKKALREGPERQSIRLGRPAPSSRRKSNEPPLA